MINFRSMAKDIRDIWYKGKGVYKNNVSAQRGLQPRV